MKLANNNPNDNEANAAARKVCRLIAEGEFKFIGPQPGPNWKAPDPLNDLKDIIRKNKENYYEQEFNRQKQEKAKYQADWYDEPIFRKGKCKNCHQEYAVNVLSDMHGLCPGCLNDYIKSQRGVSWDEETKRKEPDMRKLACSKCGKEFNTTFVGHSTQFRCFECWSK